MVMNGIVLWSLCFLIYFKPYEDRFDLHLEIMNEVFFLFQTYHYLMFTEAVESYDVQYLAGYSLIILTILNIAINVGVIIY